MSNATHHYTAVVIGSGFGGTMTALPLAGVKVVNDEIIENGGVPS